MNSNHFRPKVEPLEDRCTPATLTTAPYSVFSSNLAHSVQAPALIAEATATLQATAVRQSLTKDTAGYFVSTMTGEAAEFGEFTATARIKCKGHHCIGEVTLDFGGGNTLTCFTDVTFDTHYQFAPGTYVITRGTGRFQGASGNGGFSVDERSGGVSSVIAWDGTIDV